VTLTLKRSSLVAQVADAIRSEILANAWQEWIPSERDLSATLHVSRNTCRNAMQILRRELLIEPVLGRGIRINRKAIRKLSATRPLHSVGLIIPEVMSRLRPQNALLIDELRDELFDLGVRLELHNSPVYYHANPGHALEKLVEKNRHDCWILMLSREPLQRWFVDRGIPCIVSGSVYAGIPLPSVDQDYRAACRHAAGKLIALGHRRLVFFNRRSRAAGDLESEAGFIEGVHSFSQGKARARTVYHNDSRENVVQLVQQLYSAPAPPTGLLVANSYCYLSVVSSLARLGYRIPADVSIISRDDDAFLSYVDPEPTRYAVHPGGLIRKFMFLLRPVLEGGTVKLDPVRVLPRFVDGASCRGI
jgi:DNA-binding LacI/PurR family transcriptional regulator